MRLDEPCLLEFLGFENKAVISSAIPTEPISGMHVWLDGEDSIVTSGTDVTGWNDKSGNALHFTTVSAPNYPQATTLNGLGAVNVPNNSVWRAMDSATFTAYAAPTYTVYAVSICNLLTGSILRRAVTMKNGVAGDGASAALGIFLGTLNIAAGDSGGYRNTVQLSRIAHTAGVAKVETSVYDGTNHTQYKNGVASTPFATSGNFTNNQYRLFCAAHLSTAGTCYVGTLAEVIIYREVHNATQIAQNNSYLMNKWGIS